MKVFVVFFCMIIGHACLDLKRVENGEDGQKSNKSARIAASLVANAAINEDQYNRSRGDNAPAQSADSRSKETEASEKPSPAVKPITVTSEVKKSGQMAYLAARVIDLWSLLKHSHRHISTANRHSMEVKRSFPRPSAAIRNTSIDFGNKTRGSFRSKRKAERGGWLAFGRNVHVSQLRGVPGFKQIADECLEKERELLRSLAKSGTVSTDLLNEYKALKTKERKFVKHVMTGGEKLQFGIDDYLIGYNVLVSDPAEDYQWDDWGIRKDNAAFFDTPSPALDKYKAMKKKEFETSENFVKGLSSGPDIYEGQTGNEFEGGASANGAESAAPGFECPKKKRDSGSQAAQMHAQLFVIFLCMVIGILVVDLQQLEIGEDDLKANKNARKAKRSFPRMDRIGSAETRFDCTNLD